MNISHAGIKINLMVKLSSIHAFKCFSFHQSLTGLYHLMLLLFITNFGQLLNLQQYSYLVFIYFSLVLQRY